MSEKICSIVTERIIAMLKTGVVPWSKPWSNGAFPSNYVSKKKYRGINTFLLHCANYSSPYWLTFNQAKELGGTIRKGEKGMPVVFYSWVEKQDKASGDVEKIPFMKYYTAFNITQTEGIEFEVQTPVKINNPIEQCEKVVFEMPSPPKIETRGDRACYCPSLDLVAMPDRNRFKSSEFYYTVLFHELTHATGHESRLNRKLEELAAFGSANYSKEELIAEMGASFLSAHCGIMESTIDNAASYINGWLKVLEGDKTFVVQAASKAQRAFDCILGTKFE